MERLTVEATENSPAIDFDFEAGRFSITGESYPENVASFFNDIMSKLHSYLEDKSDGRIEFIFELIYFNSSTAKVLMEIFDSLEEAALRGVDVIVNWRYDPDDDMMMELGEEFAEDLDKATFNLVPVEG